MLKTAYKMFRYPRMVSTWAMLYFLPVYFWNVVAGKSYAELGLTGMIPLVWVGVFVVRIVLESLIEKQEKQQASGGENNA